MSGSPADLESYRALPRRLAACLSEHIRHVHVAAEAAMLAAKLSSPAIDRELLFDIL